MPVPARSHTYDFMRIAAREFLRRSAATVDVSIRRDEALAWLMRAQDVTSDGGVSYGYSIRGGWRDSYVETTGYIATTFFLLADTLGRPELKERAVRMASWLCSVQRNDGSFTNTRYSQSSGIVFDTGQDLFGLVRAFQVTGEDRFASAANLAADWLVSDSTDVTGRWTRNTHNGIPHVYNTRVAWALLQANALWPLPDRERVARANLDWALTQLSNGWFDQCAFVRDAAPFTHTIAYAIRGMWESGVLLSDRRYRQAALEAAGAVATKVREDGYLPGQIDVRGRSVGNYCCLTGNCQMAIVWAKMYRDTGDESLRSAAVAALHYVMSTQDVTSDNLNVRGAIKGSQPIWGRYAPLSYPNWATKFFVDALVNCQDWLE
jgi:hypothetical protein